MTDTKRPLYVGAFRLLRPLGEGGMAEVWSAVHPKEALQVAVKILGQSQDHSDMTTRAISREIRSVAGLDHPGIVRILDAGEISAQSAETSDNRLKQESPFFAMELAEGGTLEDLMPLTNWSDLRTILVETLEALTHSHARGVIHRDLKPANILSFPNASPGSQTRLADFGISGVFGSKNTTLGLQSKILDFCTVGYAPPEQLLGKKYLVGPASDLYSLGCLSYELACGAVPSKGTNLFTIISQQLSGWQPNFTFLFSVPAGFSEWLSALLSPEIAGRFRHAADALAALLELPAAGPSSSSAPDLSAREQEGMLSAPTQVFSADSIPTLKNDFPQDLNLSAKDLLNPWRPARGLACRRPPPVPTHWKVSTKEVGRPQLIEAGLTLFPIRPLPFVGRDQEREELRAKLSEVVSTGSPATVVIEGDAGSGKTRLARWLAETVDGLGCALPLIVTNSRFGSSRDGVGSALWQRERLGRASAHDREEALEQFTEGLGLRCSPDALEKMLNPSSSGDGPASDGLSSEAVTETITRICQVLSSRRPMILVIDDAQWGWDSLQTVEALLSQDREENGPSNTPILVVLCVREDLLRDRPIETSALSRIRNHPRTTGMKLNVLQTHECRALVAKLLPFTEEVIDYVTMRSDGLPAHAVQLVTDWIEQGHVERTDKGFTIPPRWRPDLPGTIHAALQDRIRRLFAHESANAEVALEIFVALGSDIDEVTLLEVARRAGVNTQGEFLTRLEEAGLAQFEEERWTLCWQSLTESVEQSARESGRWKQHHLQAAELFLERVDSGQDQFLSAAGRHFVAAEEWHRGIPILLQAAQHERFLRRPTRGLALLDSCDEAIQFAGSGAPQSARATSLGLRANLLKLVGKPSSEWAILAKEAEDLARKGSHMKALAEALRARSIWLRIGQRHEEGLAVIDEYLSICRTIEDPQGLIEASIQRTKMLKAGGNKKEALSSAQETVKIADELGNCTDQVNTRTALLAVHVSMGNLTEADRLLGQLSPLIGHSEVSVEVRFQILGWNGSVQFLLGNYERGREAFHSAIEQAQTSLSSMLWFRMLSDFAEAEKTAGFLERAERLFEQAEAVAAPFPNSAITRLMRVNRTILEMQRGEYARAAHRFQQIKFPSDREDDPAYGIVKGFIDFFLKQSEGSWEQAEEQLLEVRKKIDETGSLERDFAVLFEQAGRICIEAGRRELAQTALDEAIRFWEQTGGESEDLQRCLAMRPEDPRKT